MKICWYITYTSDVPKLSSVLYAAVTFFHQSIYIFYLIMIFMTRTVGGCPSVDSFLATPQAKLYGTGLHGINKLYWYFNPGLAKQK